MTVEDLSGAMRGRGDWRDKLVRNDDGKPFKNLLNACVALREHPDTKGRIAFDEFAGCTWVRDALPWDDRPRRAWSPHDDLAATEWLQIIATPHLEHQAMTLRMRLLARPRRATTVFQPPT